MLRKIFFNLAYFRDPPWDTQITPPELHRFIETHPPGRALEMGCGSGTNAITLAQNGWRVTAIDFAFRAIQLARRKARRTGVQVNFIRGDVTLLENLNEPFDLVLDIGCFHSLPPADRPAYIGNLCRLLNRQGVYLTYMFFKPDDATPGPGVVESDLPDLFAGMTLLQREDGTSRRGSPSAWLTYALPG